jgi:hypothetical protein
MDLVVDILAFWGFETVWATFSNNLIVFLTQSVTLSFTFKRMTSLRSGRGKVTFDRTTNTPVTLVIVNHVSSTFVPLAFVITALLKLHLCE